MVRSLTKVFMKNCYNDYAKTAVFSKSSDDNFMAAGKLYLNQLYLPHFPKDVNASIQSSALYPTTF